MARNPFGNTDRIAAQLVEALAETPRITLSDADPPRRPGVYCLGLAIAADQVDERGPILRCFPPEFLHGRSAIYVGAAKSLAERLRIRHKNNIETTQHLSARDLWGTWMPLDSFGAALHAEELVQSLLRAPFSEPRLAGLGSKRQGTIRTEGQRPSPWDCLFNRSWAKQATLAEQTAAQLALATVLTRPDPSPTVWDAM